MPLILRDNADHSGPLFRSIVEALNILNIQAAVTHTEATPVSPAYVTVGDDIRAYFELRPAPAANAAFDAVEIPIFVVEGFEPESGQWGVVNEADDPRNSGVTVALMLQETMLREALLDFDPNLG